MKITYLGTAASEGFPAVFCNCKYCNEARKLKGKNIRTRSQALIDDDLLLDFPQDSYMHFLQNDIQADKIKYLLITHSHMDHFYIEDLAARGSAFAHDMRAETLDAYCGKGTYEKAVAYMSGESRFQFRIHNTGLFQPFKVGDYEVTALPAKHMPGDDARIYIVSKQGKTLLYCNDTGYCFEEVFDYIQRKKIVFDMVSLDCTNVNIPIDDEHGHHMGFPNIQRLLQRLKDIGAITKDTVKYVTHFSHNGNPIQSYLEECATPLGCKVAYDGLQVEF
ncbi:MAG: hypothetical protein J6A63_06185 [Clostridia bacterium]|nr:hypothetical protein [Clostridia bacterium]